MGHSPVGNLSLEELRAPEHLDRWRRAMRAGYAAAPRCQHVRPATGWQCRLPVMREAARIGVQRCHFHLHGELRIKIDRRREERLWRQAASTNAITRERAEKALASIARRRLNTGWSVNPELEGTTLLLTAGDEAKVEEWLAGRGIRLDQPLLATGRPPTARTVDALRWAAVMALSGRIDERSAKGKINVATARDERWFKKRDALVAAGKLLPGPAWPIAGSVSAARLMVIEPPHPASKAKKAANVARLRDRRARSRIAKATGGAGKLATAMPVFGTVRSKSWAEMMQNLRREFDLDRQPEDVRDRIARAAWVYAHGGMKRESGWRCGRRSRSSPGRRC